MMPHPPQPAGFVRFGPDDLDTALWFTSLTLPLGTMFSFPEGLADFAEQVLMRCRAHASA